MVFDSTVTNYVTYCDSFSSSSNFVTAAIANTTGTGVFPFANYVKLRISTGGSNSLSFTETGTVMRSCRLGRVRNSNRAGGSICPHDSPAAGEPAGGHQFNGHFHCSGEWIPLELPVV